VNIKVNRGESGFSLIEMMTAITLLSVLSLAVFNGFGTAAQVIRISDSSSVQSQLALSKLEELAAVPASQLVSGEVTESPISVRGMTFERITTVAGFGAGRRQLKVTVINTTGGSNSVPISYESVLNPWGLR
jgi:prepilin-type N-terminal cleavage/methylation domain-containing protein